MEQFGGTVLWLSTVWDSFVELICGSFVVWNNCEDNFSGISLFNNNCLECVEQLCGTVW